jgi:predicted RNA-binding Zn-ribbon protein involved in translation (DUF1610 family)
MRVAAFHRTLEQELAALARGVSLECLVCGEFVLHEAGAIGCPECGAVLRSRAEGAGDQQLGLQTA